jgi:hypothetical protein
MNKSSDGVRLPLLAQLYENKVPALFMTYYDNKSKLILELTLWESNYFLNKTDNPLWIGSVHQNVHSKFNAAKNTKKALNLFNPLPYVIPALDKFTLRRMQIPLDMIKTSYYPTVPYILLIKKPVITSQ